MKKLVLVSLLIMLALPIKSSGEVLSFYNDTTKVINKSICLYDSNIENQRKNIGFQYYNEPGYDSLTVKILTVIDKSGALLDIFIKNQSSNPLFYGIRIINSNGELIYYYENGICIYSSDKYCIDNIDIINSYLIYNNTDHLGSNIFSISVPNGCYFISFFYYSR